MMSTEGRSVQVTKRGTLHDECMRIGGRIEDDRNIERARREAHK